MGTTRLPRPRPRPRQVVDPDVGRIVSTMHEAASRGCLLCPRESKYQGLWQPSRAIARQLGTRPDKLRFFAYGLCDRCKNRPNVQNQIEQLIISQAIRLFADPDAN
jgi:phage tail sheath protein FI